MGLKAYLPKYPEVNYGDTIVLEGTTEGDTLTNVKAIKVKRSRGFLYNFREKLVNFYKKTLPQPHSALVAGMTLGSKADISSNFWTVLKNSGTAHVVVASRMNVTLVASFLIGFLVLILPRRRAIIFALAGIWIYAILSGFEAPIVRAAIMGSFAFTAQGLGRLYGALRALYPQR
jgi:predicted membrane metal-binding protein